MRKTKCTNEYSEKIKQIYPDLPILSNKEYQELKEKYFNNDRSVAERLKLAMLGYVGEALSYMYIHEDISYNFEEAIDDVFMEIVPFIDNALKNSTYVSQFRSYIFMASYHHFGEILHSRTKNNLDVYLQSQQMQSVNADSVTDYETGMFEQELDILKLERNERILKVLKSLLPREERVVIENFGLDGREPVPCVKLAELLGISLGRVGQIRLNAVKKLQHPVFSHKLEKLVEIEME